MRGNQRPQAAGTPAAPQGAPIGQHRALQQGGNCAECGASPSEQAAGAQCSELARAVFKRGRPMHVFDLEGVFGPGGAKIPKVALRVLSADEELEAVDAAHRTRAEQSKRAGAGVDAAKADAFSFGREKNIEALFRAYRGLGPDGKPCPEWAAFPGVGWMRRELTGAQIEALLNLYEELKIKHAGVKLELDDETIEAIAKVLYDHRGDDIPEEYLKERPRWFLTHLCVLFAGLIFEARKSVDLLLQQQELWQTKEAALEAEVAELRARLALAEGAAPEELAAPPEPEPDEPPLSTD